MTTAYLSEISRVGEEVGVQKRVLTLAPHLLPHSFQPALVLNEVIDKFGGLSISELGLTNSRPGEQAPQVRVQVVHLPRRKKSRAGVGK